MWRALLLLLLPGVALAQSAGNVNLAGPSTNPHAPQITPAAVNAAVNTALAYKADASGGILTSPTLSGGSAQSMSSFWNIGTPGATSSVVVAGAAPPLTLALGHAITGTWPAGVQAINQIYATDTSDHRLAGNNSPLLAIDYTNFGGYGFGEALNLNCSTSTTAVGKSNGNFLTCSEARGSPQANVGGTSMTDTYGQNNTYNCYALLLPGATWWVANSCAENDFSVLYGASALTETGMQFVRLSNDWGNVGIGKDVNANGGRVFLYLNSQAPSYDGTSSGSAAASAGQSLPAFKTHIALGGYSQEWPGDGSTTSLMEAFAQVNTNSNGCTTGSSANCPSSSVAAAIVRPMILQNGFALGNIHFTNEPWRSPGVVIKGTGEIDVGNLQIVPTTSGATLDAKGSYLSSVVYAAEDKGGHKVGEYLYGSGTAGTVPGAILRIAAVDGSGVPTSITIVDPGYSANSAATNNAAGNQTFMGGGRVIVTPTWTDVTDGTAATISISPTSGRAKIGAGGSLITFYAGGITTAAGLTVGTGIVATNDIQTHGSTTVDFGTNFKNNGGSGGYGAIGGDISGNLAFKNRLGTVAAYYSMESTAPAFLFNNEVTFTSQVHFSGTSPSLSCTGSGSSIDPTSTPSGGHFNAGSASTSCTVTWPATLAHTPHCTLTAASATVWAYHSSPPSTTAMTVGFSGAYSGNVDYVCMQ